MSHSPRAGRYSPFAHPGIAKLAVGSCLTAYTAGPCLDAASPDPSRQGELHLDSCAVMVAVPDAAGATVAAIDLEVEALATGTLAHLTAVLALAAPGLSC